MWLLLVICSAHCQLISRCLVVETLYYSREPVCPIDMIRLLLSKQVGSVQKCWLDCAQNYVDINIFLLQVCLGWPNPVASASILYRWMLKQQSSSSWVTPFTQLGLLWVFVIISNLQQVKVCTPVQSTGDQSTGENALPVSTIAAGVLLDQQA